ncbi:hypothetical protein BDR03DRAFT_975882 [Suillus americanus]|nr:hypothetical protein BDR03DRAFT_975882 [Suillus americanus]
MALWPARHDGTMQNADTRRRADCFLLQCLPTAKLRIPMLLPESVTLHSDATALIVG